MILYTDVLQVVLLLTQAVYTSASCNRGYIRVNGVGPCTACAAGKYHEAVGSNRCFDCSTGTYSTVVGARSESTCIECDYTAGRWTGVPPDAFVKLDFMVQTEALRVHVVQVD